MSMKRLYFFAIALLLAVAGFSKTQSTEPCNVRWATFNIRCISSEDDEKGFGWDKRKDNVVNYVLDTHIDVCGFQEVTPKQLAYLVEHLKGFDYVGVPREDGISKGEATPVFYKKDKYEALDKGNFWLSETPDVVGSKGWDAALPRVASWVKLRDKKTGKVFMAVNTHYDHRGDVARKESAKLIMNKIKSIVGNLPAAVTGDFNITESNEAYTTMVSNRFKMNDAYHMTAHHTGAPYTFHNFYRINPAKSDPHKIDFIFITPTIKVNHSHVERENPNHPLSDHNPHWADLEF